MTDLEFQRVERAVRKAVTSIIEREGSITVAVRAAAVALLQGDPDPAATSPRERPSERSDGRVRPKFLLCITIKPLK